jgi:hypothetical protein
MPHSKRYKYLDILENSMKIKDLLKRNRIYESVYEQMLAYQYAYLGGPQFKMYVRKKRPSEDSTLYIDLIKNTVAQPVGRYIVDTINDVLFEPGIKRNLQFCNAAGQAIAPENVEWAELFSLDCDLNNRSINSFMEQVGDLTSIFGHCWVFVDMPQESQGNLGRPYTCAVSPLDVWDWEFDFYGGRPMLKYIKVKEMEEPDCYYIKCYHLGDATTPSYWKSYEVPKSSQGSMLEEEAELTGEGVFPLGMSIPGFIAYGRRDPRTIELGVSDIDSATDAMKEYYKLECEAYSAIQFAHTLIRADKGISIPVHAGSIVRASEGQVEAITVDTGDVNTIIAKQNNILEQIEALTGLGGLRNSKNQIASGVAIIEERKTLHRLAKSKARLMEVTEEMIWTFASRFMDMRWAGEVNYNTDYEAHDTNYRMAVMKYAKEIVPENDIIQSLITKEIIAMLAPQEEIKQYEQAYINTIENPEVKALMEQQDQQVLTRDMGSMIPEHEMYGEKEEKNNAEGEYGADIIGGGAGTPIAQTGPSYYVQQAIAVQLQGMNTGR